MNANLQLNVMSSSEDQLRSFVSELYRIFLGRDGDPGGISLYADELASGTPVAHVVHAFANSEEFKARNRAQALQGQPSANRIVSKMAFPLDYKPPGEAGRCYADRVRSGFLQRYCSGPVVLDFGFTGYDNPERKAALPHATGIDLDYPGYDGITLPFANGSVDTVFSSHCLEHILFDHAVIQDWYRVLKVGGFIVCMVPSQALYEKRRFLPSKFNADHKRMYTPAGLAASFEAALTVNTYRVRHLAENDTSFDYALGPDIHSDGAYEIEIVIEKILPPSWTLA